MLAENEWIDSVLNDLSAYCVANGLTATGMQIQTAKRSLQLDSGENVSDLKKISKEAQSRLFVIS